MTVLYLGLVTWLVTMLIVESVLFEPLRRRVHDWAVARRPAPSGPWAALLTAFGVRPPGWRDKVAYLVTCHLCTGTWVGLTLGAILEGPLRIRLVGWALNGLLYKAVAHLVLEVVDTLRRLRTGGPATGRYRSAHQAGRAVDFGRIEVP